MRVPPALFEAARLDGASRLRTLWSIALPLVAPGLAATTIFNLAAYWSEFALALVLLDSQSRFTIPLGVFSLQSAYETEWQLVAAASFIGLVPMMAAFIFLQRYFIAGLTAGAVKGCRDSSHCRSHIISHTHWDREWYLTYEQFRLRLVGLVDRLLDLMEQHPDFEYFHLDGQTIVLEDYLELRPHQEPRLRALIADGRILDRAVVRHARRVSGQRRVARAQSRARPSHRATVRHADAGRLPAGSLRPRRPDAADPPQLRRSTTRFSGAASAAARPSTGGRRRTDRAC